MSEETRVKFGIPPHPGIILAEELGIDLQDSKAIENFSRKCRIPMYRIARVFNGSADITACIALRLEIYAKLASAKFWLNLQIDHNIYLEKQKIGYNAIVEHSQKHSQKE